MIQQLRNAVVAPTGMGKNYGRIMPLLRQGWLVRQKIMHYGFLDNASQDAFAAKRKHPNCSQYYFFGRFPWAIYKKNFQYIHQQVLDKGVFGLKFLSFTCSRIT